MTPTERLARIVALMQRGYWSVNGLANELNVHPFLIRRDVETLRAAKVRLVSDGARIERRAWSLRT